MTAFHMQVYRALRSGVHDVAVKVLSRMDDSHMQQFRKVLLYVNVASWLQAAQHDLPPTCMGSVDRAS